jgi:cytochrome b subunit of formate dehydrogenase
MESLCYYLLLATVFYLALGVVLLLAVTLLGRAHYQVMVHKLSQTQSRPTWLVHLLVGLCIVFLWAYYVYAVIQYEWARRKRATTSLNS